MVDMDLIVNCQNELMHLRHLIHCGSLLGLELSHVATAGSREGQERSLAVENLLGEFLCTSH